MTELKEYDQYDALGLAELIRKKEISATELCETAIEKIEDLNPKLNAVVTKAFDQAREYAKGELPEGPFTGVPFLLKDLLAVWKGVRMTNGSRMYRDYVPDYDTEMVKRFKRSGVVILGKTNTPELGLLGVTEPELHGPTKNPWNVEHTPGGSSGGTASAVSSGMVPMASGGDGGGSIRIPSSCCGLFGIKPTRFRNPTGPKLGRIWQGAVSEHVLTRSVRDSAAMLDATQGADVGSPFVIPPPERPYLEEIETEPGSLRIAFSTAGPYGGEVDPECVEAVTAAAKLLEDLGHKVEEVAPELDGDTLADSYFLMTYGEVAADIQASAADVGKKPTRSDYEVATWFLGELAGYYTAGDFANVVRVWDDAARTMGRFHQTYDLFLTPTMAAPPAKIGELLPKPYENTMMSLLSRLGLGRLIKASGMVRVASMRMLDRMPFTQLANMTGQPAMSVPLHTHGNGLPCGVQFIAPFGKEDVLFRLAAQLEDVKPWKDKRPEQS